MPHMSPILWSMILVFTFLSIIVLLSMMYFNNQPLTPASSKTIKEIQSSNWLW
uniref:ATP synthase F0 subunit 8 n=1 Tax=Pollicipes pollicipes TaxID=41117 RepID=C1K6G0_POLPL|nr:ATP synthase F0 subunit 8 [Pollicipes pollicipes]